METGNVLPDKSTKPGGSVVYVADAGKFAYHMDSTLYGDWDVAGVRMKRKIWHRMSLSAYGNTGYS